MIRKMKKAIISAVEYFIRRKSWKQHLNRCKAILHCEDITYSQNCEDIIVSLLTDNKVKGTYVDVGAHHPVRFSNTFRFYLSGWNGINIDPLPNAMTYFNQYRPDDVNLNMGVASKDGELTYFNFEEPAYNTLNGERAEEVIRNNYSTLKEKISVPVHTLAYILDKHLNNREIDLLTIDVESFELEVLKSNDWSKYKPKLIVMESLVSSRQSLDRIYEDPSIQYVVDKGYMAVAKVSNAVFLKRIN